MPSLSLGINTVLRAMQAEQVAIDVTGHNIANATTDGYSRQIAQIVTTEPVSDPTLLPAGAGQIGTGATVATIQRAHDDFVQQQIIYQNSQQTQREGTSSTLTNISQIFNEPTDQGFSSLLSNFFSSWQSLSNNASDDSVRQGVLASGQQLANGFAAAASSLTSMQSDENTQVNSLVTQINGITSQIGSLNQQITEVKAIGQAPNDLMDTRDQLLGQLSNLVGVQYTVSDNGAMNVSLAGGGALVQGTSSFSLATTPSASNPQFSDVVFQGSTNPVAVSGGQLGGAFTDRDSTIQSRLDALNSLAANVASAVNAIHATGYGSNGATGLNFFTGTTAASIAVNPTIVADASNIAASATANAPSDGSIALAIAQLAENPATGQTSTLSSQYNGIITKLGVDGQQAQANAETGTQVLQQLNAQETSVSGVSTNEEASNLLQYQNAYEAAARVVSIMNQTISDMITQIG